MAFPSSLGAVSTQKSPVDMEMAAVAGAAIFRCLKGSWGSLRTLGRPLHHSVSCLSSSSAWADNLLHPMDQRDTWDHFYAAKKEGAASPSHFDWFFGYRHISGFLLSVLQGLPSGQAQILDVGCGTSALGLGLYRDSPRQLHISCLDFSPPAIETLRRLLRDSPPPLHPLSELHCCLADATELAGSFAPKSFHLVLDKGTCDAMLRCPQGPGKARRLVAECLRLLKPQGSLLQFSDEDPDARVPFLEQAGGVPITVKEIGQFNSISYYAYVLGAPDSSAICRAGE